MATIAQVKEHLTGMLHGGTLNKVRNIEAAFERAGNTMLAIIDPIETMRSAALSETVHDDLLRYAIPTDFKSLIDLAPQADRSNLDSARRVFAESFSLKRSIADKQISIESSEGTKFLKINWRVRTAKVLNTNDSLTDNGSWSVVGSATGLATDTIYKYSGAGSVRFDLTTTGDGIQNTTMSSLDLTDEDEIADVIIPVYFPSVTNLTSVTAVWGNDLTTAYWTSVAQTAQADGTAFAAGWNILKFPWSTATETGTVAPATIDSFKLTVAASGAIADIRVDNILFGIGLPFELKYYSQYFVKNSSGTFLQRTTSDDDTVVFTGLAYQIYLLECLRAMSHQIEGEDSTFDISFADRELGYPNFVTGLYRKHMAEFPTQSKKQIGSYGTPPRFRRFTL